MQILTGPCRSLVAVNKAAIPTVTKSSISHVFTASAQAPGWKITHEMLLIIEVEHTSRVCSSPRSGVFRGSGQDPGLQCLYAWSLSLGCCSMFNPVLVELREGCSTRSSGQDTEGFLVVSSTSVLVIPRGRTGCTLVIVLTPGSLAPDVPCLSRVSF